MRKSKTSIVEGTQEKKSDSKLRTVNQFDILVNNERPPSSFSLKDKPRRVKSNLPKYEDLVKFESVSNLMFIPTKK